ncbi:MAG: DUF1772 domain-containing protein [Planctomycetota bacterium]
MIVLTTATLLCSLVAGLVFAFAVVVMPGIRNLNDRDFIRAFQVMDRVIQNNQPLFMLVWVGSAVSLIASACLGITQVEGANLVLLVAATCAYLFSVQLPTIAINIPLNNRLQTLNVEVMDETDRQLARDSFETRWNRWNVIRTLFACLTTAMLLILLLRL